VELSDPGYGDINAGLILYCGAGILVSALLLKETKHLKQDPQMNIAN